jgi:two-component system, sensor histidine kinase and response regulator
MNQPSILVVDDEPDNFDVIETLLPDGDYILHYASSGQKAIAGLDTFQPDLILLDVMMPEVEGIEVCRQIKAISKWQTVPIIMVTALSTKEDLARCLQAGADDFISKPVNAIELRARVHSMLRIRQQYHRIQSLSKLQRNTIHLLKNNLQELRGNLAFSLPHELNTPLNSISGAIRLLLKDVDAMSSESIHELLDISYQSVCRLENLTQRFLNYLYLELSTTLLKGETNDAQNVDNLSSNSTLIEHLAKPIAQEVGRFDDLTYQIEDTKLAVSPKHLQWIVHELLDNAFKFSQPRTPVTLRSKSQDGMFQLWISDRGRGMTHEQIASLGAFMKFERRTQEPQGAGLGLKIAQKAVELYGGRFRITSVYQQETTIYLTLPLENLENLEQQSEQLSQGEVQSLVSPSNPYT